MGLRVAVVGGGLGGLAAALHLRRAGIEAVVYEQASELREVGAGVMIAPNMVRLIRRLGLGDALARCAVWLEAAWEYRRWEDGEVLYSQPMGEACERLYGANVHTAHRADLLAMFHGALPAWAVHLDHRLVALEQGDTEVELTFAHRAGGWTKVRADAVVGADGIHSTVRPLIVTEVEPHFCSLSAFRALVPVEKAPEYARRRVQSLWLGPGRHLVHYPVSGGRLVNVVAVVPTDEWLLESWTADGDLSDFAREFEGWDDRVRRLIAAAASTKRWALYDRSPLERWTSGRVTLLGDAAHAMLPFFAQGAGQAIEDAAVLARCLREADRDSVPKALLSYEAARRPRAGRVQLMSRGRAEYNHLPDGPAQRERDAGLRDGDLLRHNSWLYSYDVDAEPLPG
ncbi:FAD-dependent monooxygenase [Sphaerisporangium fuscum]|uniref:FAD-dependent monooxygenase n=1 Tax=Sphaerisporangium fuscum TaxID=2835868 RepID=UPI00202996B9|nr:FAD-dependent monooxygenase [Sphaerisporangium fuscum]